jgi:hypothetical protein
MAADTAIRTWPLQLSRYWIESAEVLAADANEEEKPGRDSLGNPGRVLVVRRSGRLGVRLPRGRVVERMTTCGLRPVRDTAEETELAEPREEEISEEIDPFLLERTVVVTVRGREFSAEQRTVVERKVERLRREVDDAATPDDRRAAAARLLGDLEEGLRSTLDVKSVERRFRPAVAVKDPVASIGAVVTLRPGARIVYRVAPAKPEPGDETDAEPMVFHVVGLGAREAVLLYTGGVHGQRHLRDLEESCVHNAWFANRERVKTEATAPWIGRRLYRSLAEEGCGEIVVHRRRDPQPVAVDKVGEGVASVVVDGIRTEVPVLHCRTSRDDELTVLADAANPLLLRLVEAEADLVRTIEAIHTLPSHPFAFTPGPDDAAMADGDAEDAA